jgi:hypothetical protein
MSKKSYLTHGIVVSTAITMVFFEVLPLTSWIATVKEMQNENRVYANQEYDDHIVSPIAITGRSTILYMKTPLALTKKIIQIIQNLE